MTTTIIITTIIIIVIYIYKELHSTVEVCSTREFGVDANLWP